MTTMKEMLRKYVGQEISVYGAGANIFGVLKEVFDDVAIMDTKHSHNNYVRIDAINSFNKPDEEDETITDFTALIDKVVEHMRSNRLSMVSFVRDTFNIGFMCLEDGKLFLMSMPNAFKSAQAIIEKERRALLVGAVYDLQYYSELILQEIRERSAASDDDLIEVDVVYRSKEDLADNDYKDDGPGWYVWEQDYRDEGYVVFFNHEPTDAELKEICPTYVRSKK